MDRGLLGHAVCPLKPDPLLKREIMGCQYLSRQVFDVALERLMIRISVFAFYSFVFWDHVLTLDGLGAR